MGHAIVLLYLGVVALLSLAFPWIGAVNAYLFVVLTPQNVWYWDFLGLRPIFWTLLPTGVGFLIGVLTGRIDLGALKNRRSAFLAVLFVCLVISYYFGPFTNVGGPYRFENAAFRLDESYKIFALFFIAASCIDRESRLKTLYWVMVGSGIYLVYWANHQYLIGHYSGRLSGPASVDGGGMYVDQNSFAMLFVVLQPFIWYLGVMQRKRLLKWGIWLVIPFCWNAVFLTGSRGGLLGLCVTLLLIVLRSNRRLLGFALIPAFVFVFMWEGGPVMKHRADSITNYEHNASAEGRIESWHAATRMIADHPLTGVGLASYGPAFPHYSNAEPREAHDTFLQIAAESGVLAGAMYLLVIGSSLGALWKNGLRMKKQSPDAVHAFMFAVNEATLVGLSGLVTCSIFLSLQDFEIFYCLMVATNAVLLISRRRIGLSQTVSVLDPGSGCECSRISTAGT